MKNQESQGNLTRNRSLRERIRDSTNNIINFNVADAFSSSSKSRSVDQVLLSSSPPKHLSSHVVTNHPLEPPSHAPASASGSAPYMSDGSLIYGSAPSVGPYTSDGSLVYGPVPSKVSPLNSGSTKGDSSSSSPVHSSSQSHVVSNSDTLTSLAARYDCTPSELIKLNRLNTRLVFPGQVLKVPIKKDNQDNVFVDNEEDRKSSVQQQRKFVKIAVRHITDGNGVVSGTLLVTPNAVMFDPNVSDPLVLEQGAESYGVILPLEVVVGAGIFSDIAHMKVNGKGDFVPPGPPPLLYPNTTAKAVGAEQSRSISKSSLDMRNVSEGEGSSRKDKVLKRLSFPLTWMESLTANSEEGAGGVAGGVAEGAKSAPPTAGHLKKRDSKSFHDDTEGHSNVGGISADTNNSDFPMANLLRNVDRLIERHDSRGAVGVCEDLTWYLCLTSGRAKEWKPRSSGLIVSYGQKNHVRPEYWFHIVDNKQVDELYKFWMVWWPHLYTDTIDTKLIKSRGYELIDFGSMYLEELECKESSCSNEVNEFTKESWEMLKSPYTKLSSLLNRSQTLLTSTSSSATNFGQGILDSISDFASLDYYNEEVVSMSDELRLALYGSSEEYSPELIGVSEILNDNDTANLAKHLTARAQGYPWSLQFTSSTDGFSLSTLYRKMLEIGEEETPILMLIEDTCGNVFGALVSTSLRPSDSFYGNGQSFLFNLKPNFKVFKWTGENMFFIKGANDGIVIGAGDGKFGLWLDGDLNCGRSESCSTYGNPPLVEDNDFVIKTLECWAFLSLAGSSGGVATSSGALCSAAAAGGENVGEEQVGEEIVN